MFIIEGNCLKTNDTLGFTDVVSISFATVIKVLFHAFLNA